MHPAKSIQGIFEPLLHLECHAQVLSAKREMSSDDHDSVYRGVITSIAVVDGMYELTFAFSDFISAKDICELDLLVSTSGPSKSVLGMVCKSGMVREREAELVIRVHLIPSVGKETNQDTHQLIRQGSIWTFRWVCSLVTNLREYLAVQNMPLLSLHKAILDPRTVAGLALPDSHRIESMTRSFGMHSNLNDSQRKAIAVALLTPHPFTLIQGPPGTGKTSVIEGLLGVIFGATSATDHPAPIRHDRILICAPSNAAIDEIVRRIKGGGIKDAHENRVHLRVARIGAQDAMHEGVRDVSIEYLVERALEGEMGKVVGMMEGQRAQVKQLRDALDACNASHAPSRLADLKSQLWQAREDARRSGVIVEERRQSIRQRILASCHVVCSTLSGSAHDVLARAGLDFRTVIIDEACQAVEPSTLIPLQYNCQKCILIGGRLAMILIIVDPNQLPPTIISQAAARLLYDQSLFKRLHKFMPVQLLNLQYRMHPEISRFPSQYFYSGALRDASGMSVKCSRAWHNDAALPLLGPYRFFDIPGTGADEHWTVRQIQLFAAKQIGGQDGSDVGCHALCCLSRGEPLRKDRSHHALQGATEKDPEGTGE